MKMSGVCSACLSRERSLVPVRLLKEALQNVLSSIIYELNFDMVNSFLCWECEAVLKKCYRFRTRVLHALDHWSHMQYHSLSSLTDTTKDGYDALWSEDGVKIEPDDYKCAIKGEVNDDNDCDNDDDDTKLEETNTLDDNINYLQIPLDKEHIPVVSDSYKDKFTVKKLSLKEFLKLRDEEKKSNCLESPFQCTSCIKEFLNEEQLQDHLDSLHSKIIGSHVCPICECRFANKVVAGTHYEGHLQLYQCACCVYRHTQLDLVLSHYDNKHTAKKIKVARSRSKRTANIEQQTPQRCHICAKILANGKNLKLHMLIHTKTKPQVECEVCGKQMFKNSLKTHMKIHQDLANEQAYCVECGIQFKNDVCYKYHLKFSKKHSQADYKFICDYCGDKFKLKKAIQLHILSKHMKLDLFKCHICHKGFILKHNMKKHIQSRHEGMPKNKICTYCGKGFTDNRMLLSHVMIHTGEKPFKCDQCEWSFRQKGTLNTHMRLVHLKLPKRVKRKNS